YRKRPTSLGRQRLTSGLFGVVLSAGLTVAVALGGATRAGVGAAALGAGSGGLVGRLGRGDGLDRTHRGGSIRVALVVAGAADRRIRRTHVGCVVVDLDLGDVTVGTEHALGSRGIIARVGRARQRDAEAREVSR